MPHLDLTTSYCQETGSVESDIVNVAVVKQAFLCIVRTCFALKQGSKHSSTVVDTPPYLFVNKQTILRLGSVTETNGLLEEAS